MLPLIYILFSFVSNSSIKQCYTPIQGNREIKSHIYAKLQTWIINNDLYRVTKFSP